MTYQISKMGNRIPKNSLVFLSFGSLAILFVFFIDLEILNISPLAEGSPNFGIAYLLRTALIVLSSGFFVISVTQLQTLKNYRVLPKSVSGVWDDWGLLTWSMDDFAKRDIISLKVKELTVYAVLLLSLFFLFIFLTRPAFFSKLGREGNPVETISAAVYFLNCGLFLYISFSLHQQLSNTRVLYLIISFSFTFVFFLLGMEEISWFQRVLGIETPDLFGGNMQNEMNLHNFATNEIENLYYFGGFFFLIVIPFFDDKSSLIKRRDLSFFMPSLFILFVSAIFVAYNYDMWNILFTQLSFFITFFILIHYSWLYLRQSDNSFVPLVVIIIIFVLTQILFLAFGDHFVHVWDVTEYKELFLPLAFLMYSVEILQKSKRFQGGYIQDLAPRKKDVQQRTHTMDPEH